jgi:hypothetical protein
MCGADMIAKQTVIQILDIARKNFFINDIHIHVTRYRGGINESYFRNAICYLIAVASK